VDNPPPPPGPGDLPPPPFVQPPAPPEDPAAAGFSYTPAPYYGGFWLRFVAYVIDSVIVAIPSWIVGTIVGAIINASRVPSDVSGSAVSNLPPGALLVILSLYVILLIWAVGYFVYFWSIGATLGMRVLRLRVVDADTGRPIGIARALLRYLGFFISSLVCYIGLIWAAFDTRKQGWHDKIANTVVLWG
jgi:uncharacterized RDD family membrane protein YckC